MDANNPSSTEFDASGQSLDKTRTKSGEIVVIIDYLFSLSDITAGNVKVLKILIIGFGK